MIGERSELEIRAIAFVQARMAKTMARLSRNIHRCTETDGEYPPCNQGPDAPEEWCDECKKRQEKHLVVAQRSAEATSALRALTRAVRKVASA